MSDLFTGCHTWDKHFVLQLSEGMNEITAIHENGQSGR